MKEVSSPQWCVNRETIVISEGLGGLGIEMSKWMIDEIVTESSQFPDWISLQRLAQDHQSSVTTKQVDLTNFDPLIDTLRQTNSKESDSPIRGISHSAMILHDSLLANMTEETLARVMRPKIHGAWNLPHVLFASSGCFPPFEIISVISASRVTTPETTFYQLTGDLRCWLSSSSHKIDCRTDQRARDTFPLAHRRLSSAGRIGSSSKTTINEEIRHTDDVCR